MNTRFDDLIRHIDQRFDALEKRLDRNSDSIDALRDEVVKIGNRVAVNEASIESLRL